MGEKKGRIKDNLRRMKGRRMEWSGVERIEEERRGRKK